MTSRQLAIALAAYALLAVAAGLVLKGDLRIRIIIWVLFAGLAVKTYAAYKLQRRVPTDAESGDEPESTNTRNS